MPERPWSWSYKGDTEQVDPVTITLTVASPTCCRTLPISGQATQATVMALFNEFSELFREKLVDWVKVD